ncbi:MAG: transporter [Blastocatellia bacterium]
MRKSLLLLGLTLCLWPLAAQAQIADNSFLVEEAYNQEPGVVQHINTLMRDRNRNLYYSLTQEWPVFSQKHQVSYTLPMQRVAGPVNTGRGLGDVALNYRYQLVGNEKIAVAPRVTLLVPTGSATGETGAGSAGFQFNLPVSVQHSKHFVTHWNAGTTITPNARNVAGDRAGTTGFNLGQSTVWLAKPNFNLLVETVWDSTQTVSGPGAQTREYGLLINPGVRWAHNFRNGLQIVPGIGVPIGVGPSRGERGLFFYLSFEHPFKKEKR